MSSDDAPSPPAYKHNTSSFAEVFKSLGVARPKSLSPVSLPDSGDTLSQSSDGRKSNLIGFGFESMHRGSVVSSSSDTTGAPDFETALRTLSQRQNLPHAIDEAEHVSKTLQWFSPEQSLALWEAGSYLIYVSDSTEARRAGSTLMEVISTRQDLSPGARRAIFESISQPSEPDVIPTRIQSLIQLSDHGRKLEFTTSSILPIISSCVVPLYDLISTARLKARKSKVGKANGLAYDDGILDDLFQFAVDVVTLQRRPPSSDEVESLLEQIFTICKKTSVAVDIKNSLAVFDSIILYSNVPDGSFVPMLEVLCSIHASVKSLSGPTSRAVRNLAKSRKQQEMVNTLYTFLLETSEEKSPNLNVLRGAVHVFTDLIRAHGQDGIPLLHFEHLVDALQVVLRKDDGRLEADILELCLNVLEGEYAHVALGATWSGFADLMISCSLRAIDEPEERSTLTSSPQLLHPRGSVVDDTKSNILSTIIQITSALESLWDRMNTQQKLDVTRFLMNVSQHLEPPQAELILSAMRDEKLCFPESPGWIQHCQRLIRCFVRSRTKPSDIRILALDTVKEPFSNAEYFAQFEEQGLLDLMLEHFAEEDDVLFLETLVSFLVDASILTRNDITFKSLVDTISSRMIKDWSKEGQHGVESPSSMTSSQHIPLNISMLETSLANICSVGLVKMFLRSLNVSAAKSSLIFEALLNIAESSERPSDSRLTVLKLFFRLRCDSSGSVVVISAPEEDFFMNVSGRNAELSGKTLSSSDDHTRDYNADSEPRPAAQGRNSLKEPSASISNKSSIRNTGVPLRASKPMPPVWTYSSPQVLPEEPPDMSSPFVFAHTTQNMPSSTESVPAEKVALKANMWLETVISLLQREANWDLYSYVLTHLAPQLRNRGLFTNAVPQIKLLRNIMCDQVKNDTFREPPAYTGVKKTDVAGYIFDSLCVLISYHEIFAKSEEDELVRAFMLGIIGSWGGTSRGCIHALSVCCHEIPLSVTKSLNGILDKMSKVITLANLAVHILEFLALLARLPDVYINLREEEIRTVFGICIRFLQTSREQRFRASESPTRNTQISARLGSGMRETAALPADMSDPSLQDGMSRYIYTLTHHVMVFWFLSLKLQDRAKHVNWITSRLIFRDEHGKEMVEEQSQVFLDLMQRVTFSDLGETIPYTTFPPSPTDGPVSKKSWAVGMSIITVETAGVSGLTQITKRQASGTTYATYQQRTAPVLPHQVPPTPDAHLHIDEMRTAVLPSHVMLQLTTTAFPTPTSIQPIVLPDDDVTRRALSTFDRNDIVDGHKIGVLYIDNGQAAESEILSNTSGSSDYEYFLSGLGTKVPLQGAQFNTQGLHADFDGEATYAWRDRVTEIVYHVATMMPTNFDNDPSCVNKKRHIGNDFVNIIFNRSNSPFQFDTIPSQFNFFNIVISPVCRLAYETEDSSMEPSDFEKLCYSVQVMSKAGFPEISPAAAPKVISGKNLAPFVRFLALNASVFSHVWNSQGGEHVSSWRNRLREIKRLRERALDSQFKRAEGAEDAYPGQRRNTKANIYSEELPVRSNPMTTDFATDWNASADANILQNLDFSRWGR